MTWPRAVSVLLLLQLSNVVSGWDGVPDWPDYIHFASPPENYNWIVILGGIFAFGASWGIGANDCANSWASNVGARTISVRNACILAVIMETVGAFALGANVGGTVKNKIIPPSEYCFDNYSLVVRMCGMGAVMLGSFVWLTVCSRIGLPSSTTHAAVGGVIGFGIATRGWAAVTWWETVGKIFISWVTSPLLSGVIGFAGQFLVNWFLFRGPPGSIYRKNHLWLPTITGIFLGVSAVFAYYIGGKSSPDIKDAPMWTFIVVFVGVAIGMTIILNVLAWYLRRKWNIDLHAYDNFVDDEVPSETRDEFDGEMEQLHTSTPQPTPQANYLPDAEVLNKDEESSEADTKGTKLANTWNGEKMVNPMGDIYSGCSQEVVAANQLWIPLAIVVASVEAFAHGANDVGNAIGPYSGLLDAFHVECPKGTKSIPYWVLAIGAIGLALGLVTYGHRVMHTLGVNISRITPQKAAMAEIGTVVTVLIATSLAIPVSTTHCSVGAITGMALLGGCHNVKWKTVMNVIWAMVFTMPTTALVVAATSTLWIAAVFGPSYPGPSFFNMYCNQTNPGPWIGQDQPPNWDSVNPEWVHLF